ncbi:Cna B-type domain-containing protein [Candidatus Saccharibacteria bacterium]|nr:Cna B-type domain-containing protein [Candidatus Saccharibacteria bacterium]
MKKSFKKIKAIFQFLSIAIFAMSMTTFRPAYAAELVTGEVSEDYAEILDGFEIPEDDEEANNELTIKNNIVDENDNVLDEEDSTNTAMGSSKKAKLEDEEDEEKEEEEGEEEDDDGAPVGSGNRSISEAVGSAVIPFEKSWNDADEAKYRPDSITVSLYKYTGEVFDKNTAILVETAEVTADSSWKYNFDISNEELQDIRGNNYKFAVVEEAIDLYYESEHVDPTAGFTAPRVNGGWVKYAPCNELNISSQNGSYAIVASKLTRNRGMVVWSATALTPVERRAIERSIMAQPGVGNPGRFIYISGEGSSYGITVTSDKIQYSRKSDWSLIFFGSYVPTSANITSAQITNKHDVEYVDLSFSKVWDDEDNRDDKRVATKVNLLADGVEIDSVDITIENAVYEFSNLIKCSGYVKVDGEMVCQEIVYTLSEEEIDGYTTTIDGDMENGFVITNKHVHEDDEGYGSGDEGGSGVIDDGGENGLPKTPYTGVYNGVSTKVKNAGIENSIASIAISVFAIFAIGATVFSKR